MRTIEIIERPNRIDTIINFDNIEVTAFFSDNRKACQYNPKRNIAPCLMNNRLFQGNILNNIRFFLPHRSNYEYCRIKEDNLAARVDFSEVYNFAINNTNCYQLDPVCYYGGRKCGGRLKLIPKQPFSFSSLKTFILKVFL